MDEGEDLSVVRSLAFFFSSKIATRERVQCALGFDILDVTVRGAYTLM